MSAFSYQQPQIILPNSSREMSNACSCCLYVNSSNDLPQASAAEAKVFGSRSSLETARIFLSGDTQYASMVVDPNSSVKVPQPDGPVEKTRKNIDITCLSSDLPQEIKVPKKSNGRRQKKAAEGKKNKSDKKREEAKMSREHPTGYIHVRARRGQATDSHSLAERVRREKISQRMKLLQGLVPGCEKITGKALLLDAIINYVRTLQHHVEFLSMKLALVNPALLHDLDKEVISGHVDQQQITGSMSQASLSVQSVHQTYPIQQAAFDETTANYPMMDNSAHRSLHGQGTIALPQINDTYLLMQVADQGLELLNQVVLNNVSFQ